MACQGRIHAEVVVPSYPWTFSSCVFSRLPSFTRGESRAPYLPKTCIDLAQRQHTQGGLRGRWAVESCLPVSGDTWCPWLLQLLKGPRSPDSASKSTELRSVVLHVGCYHRVLNSWECCLFSFGLYLDLTWIWLLLAVLHAAPTALLEMAKASLSEVQQDVFSFAVEGRRSFISVFGPRADKE